jgi:hypothetical protein
MGRYRWSGCGQWQQSQTFEDSSSFHVAYRLNQKDTGYLWLPYQPSIITSVPLTVDDPGHHHFHENYTDLLNHSKGWEYPSSLNISYNPSIMKIDRRSSPSFLMGMA